MMPNYCKQLLAATTAMLMFTGSIANAADKPTVILVHGAFAESNSWDAVTRKLIDDGYAVIGVANPLRGVRSDADYLSAIVASTRGPVILVGHSYGGMVISNATSIQNNIKGLVFVSAFAPESGETVAQLADKFPGSTLGTALGPPVELPGGGKDLYIDQSKFRKQFAADVPVATAKLMAAGQRPVAQAVLEEASGKPVWRDIPSWFIYGGDDRNIPSASMAWMAARAGAKKTIVVRGASHVVMVSNPALVTRLIEDAASASMSK
jgi:pimeloyl-ACP methyl ester carboxylesterase